MNILFLDDSYARHREFSRMVESSYARAESVEDAVALLKEQKFDLVFLDHDLSEEHYSEDYASGGTGMEVVEFISKMKTESRPDLCVVHSMNVVMAPMMVAALQRAGVPTVRLVFGSREFVRFCLGTKKT